MNNQIRRARKAAHITQEQLAKSLGINRATLSRYESGEIDPPTSQLRRIAAALGTTVNWLLPPDNYWEDASGVGHTEPMAPAVFEEPTEDELREQLNDSFSILNHAGQQKAVDSVEVIAGNPKYQRTPAAESPSPAPEGTDTTPDKKPPEDP